MRRYYGERGKESKRHIQRERECVCVCVIITYLYCIVQHCVMIVLIVPFIRWKGEVSVGY